MTFFRVFTVTARVVRQVSVGSAVMSNPSVGWSCTVVSVEIGEGGSEICDVVSAEVRVLLVAVRQTSKIARRH